MRAGGIPGGRDAREYVGIAREGSHREDLARRR